MIEVVNQNLNELLSFFWVVDDLLNVWKLLELDWKSDISLQLLSDQIGFRDSGQGFDQLFHDELFFFFDVLFILELFCRLVHLLQLQCRNFLRKLLMLSLILLLKLCFGLLVSCFVKFLLMLFLNIFQLLLEFVDFLLVLEILLFDVLFMFLFF